MGQAIMTIIVKINGKDVPVDDAFNDLTPEQQEIEKAHIADQMMAGKKFGGIPVAEPKEKEPGTILGLPTDLAPAAGAAVGATVGAALGPTVGTSVDKPIATAANAIRPTAPSASANVNPNAPQSVRNWLATQTSTPYAGGRDYEEANRKANIAGGKPVQSRGSSIPIRRGGLGIDVQPPAPTMPQRIASNVLNADQLPKAGIPRRVLGMGVAGGELGNMAKDIDEGNYGRAAISGLGALGGMASQSRIRPVRAVGTALSMGVPAMQKFFLNDKDEDKSNIQEKAAGGSVTSPKLQSLSDYLDQLMKQAQSAPAPVPAAPAMPQGQPPQGGMVLPQQDPMFAPQPQVQPQPQAPLGGMPPVPMPQMAKGGKVGALEAIAKKTIGFLESTPTKPNELVGTRYKTTDLGGLIEPTPFDIEKALGAKVMHRPYDLSGRNQLVEEVSGHKLINPIVTEGGQPFGRDIKLQATGQGGASNKSINDRILKRVEAAAREGDGRVFNNPSTMTYGSEAFSTMPIDIIMDLIKQRELPKETLEYLSNLVRAKSPALQNFVGFDDPRAVEQFLKGGYGLTTTPGKLRVGATQAMMGKENKAQSLIDYNHEDLFNAIRAPELRGVPPGYTGETIMEAVPGHRGFDVGNHGAYDSGDASIYRGQGINAPISVWMPDQYKQALAEVRSAPKTADKALGHQRAMARNVLGTAEEGVAQTITPQVADNLQRYQEAIKAGNLDKNNLDAIHKYIYGDKADQYAKGGKVVDKVLQEAKEAFKRRFTTGFYHGSPDPTITAFDPLKSTKRDVDLVTPGVTFVGRSPKFSDSFTNGKGPYISLKTGEAIPAQSYTQGATMYPVSVDLSNHFDPMTAEGREIVRSYVASKYADDPSMARKFASRIEDPHSNWTSMESPSFLQHLRDTGHTSFAVNESGYPNVGVLDPSKIRGKFAKYNPEDADSPDFMKAEGGAVEEYAAGGLAKLGKSLARHAHGQDARVAQALEEYLKGNISQEERIRIMNQILPARKWNELPPNYTDEQIRNALMSNKQSKALAPIPEGMQVGNRLDIPAYTQQGVYVDTTHGPDGKAISYGRTGHLKDVEFSSKPNQAVRVGLGTKEQALTPLGAEIGSAKSPFALIKGTHQGTSDDEVRRMIAEMMQDPNYTQIGMDPRRHSQFYDKSTGMPVFSAEEKLQSGPLIIAPKKGLETTSWDDPRLNLTDFPGKKYADGGLTQAFNPQSEDYDYETAMAYGMGPNGTGENAGHWGSVAPTSDDERMLHGLPEDSYVVLKGKNHPTFNKAEAAEKERGSKIQKAGKRYYSVPK